MNLEIRPVSSAEADDAWRVLAEFRTDLGHAEFTSALAHLRVEHHYELLGAFEDGRLVGIAGFRSVRTFARGLHLHIDELVVAADARGRGIGRELLRYAEHLARDRGLKQVFLDSRPGALGFYEREGYRQHESVLVKKHWDDDRAASARDLSHDAPRGPLSSQL